MSGSGAGNAKLARKRRQRNGRRGAIALLACVIMVATAVALMVPAISMTKGDLDAPGADGSSVATRAVEEAPDAEAELSAQEADADEADAVETQEADAQAEADDDADDAAATEDEDADAGDDGEAAADASEDADSPEATEGEEAGEGEQPEAVDSEGEDPEDGEEAEGLVDGEDAEGSEGSEQAEDPDEAPMPAQPFYGELRDANDKVTMTVDVEAPEGALPAGTTMQVQAVEQADVQDAIEQALEQEDAGKLAKVQAVDITFLDAEGAPIEPAAPVNVKLSSKQIAKAAKADQQPLVAHIDDAGEAELVQTLTDEELEARDIAPAQNEIHFDADAFSVYAVVYTVDFHWEVDGKTYDFSIPGGGFISLTGLVEALGIAGDGAADAADDAATDSDKPAGAGTAADFVAEVANVEFSSPELLWVGKADEATTVGELKQANDLEPQESAERTEEQVAETDATKVAAGDWALISLKPFTSAETLTVTMKNGDMWTIKVTDDQDALGLDGKQYIISHNNLAMIGEAESNSGQGWSRKDLKSGATTDDRAPWTIEYSNAAGGYYLKSYNGKYLRLEPTDYNNTLRDVTLTDSKSNATVLSINRNYDSTYTISGKNRYNNNTFYIQYHENGQYDPYFAGQYAATNGVQNLTLTEYVPPTPHMDWLLYTDEDGKKITIHVGDTITLRPYGEWEWKDGDIQQKYWDIPLPNGQNWTINNGDSNGSRSLTWDNGIFSFKRFVKVDGELNTKYWSLQGTAKQTGDYTLRTSDGHTITVHVVSGESDRVPQPITNTANIKVNLFDYDRDGVLDPPDNTNLANGYVNDSINYNKKPFLFLSSGSGNSSGHYGHGYTMTQFDLNDYTGDRAHTGLVQNTLDENGYPQLTSQYDSKQSSLGYLFDTSQTTWTDRGGMIAYPDVNGLFQKDSNGYYYYNSNVNYAYYDTSTGELTLYEHTYTQVSKSNGEVNTKPIGFFPFHEYNSSSNLWVNQNHELNHHLGLSMDIDFMLPANGLDENGKPITFDFSGDDDLWVFAEWIDDNGQKHSKLLLDLGGIHQPVTGSINFTNTSTGLEKGRSYTLKVFYLERGGCDSNCSIRFNLPIVKDLTVAKKLNGLTPAERQKYLQDTFLYELAFKNSSEGMDINLSDDNAVWSNQAWRDGFALYNTPVNTTNEKRNKTVYHSNGGDVKGYPVTNGHITLKNGESFTVSGLPRTDIFYLAEENQLDMQQFETPHAERLFVDASNVEHEEEVGLHADTAVSDGNNDWETKPYALMDTEKLVYTNTLQERNLDVWKQWSDGNESHSDDAVTFKLKAQVRDGGSLMDYVDYMQNYNQANGTNYSTNINAQRTQTTSSGVSTTTENVLNKQYTLNNANDWKVFFEHLPKKTQAPNAEGKEIVYTVEEISSISGYRSTVGSVQDANKVYLDIFKFWPDDNSNHRESSAETFHVKIKDSNGNYITAQKDANGEWRYTGTTDSAGATVIDFGSNTSNAMFDYAARVNGLPRYDNSGDVITYTFEEVNDEDENTTGLVMFTRPAEKIEILNSPNTVDINISKVGENGQPLAGAIFQLNVKNGSSVYQPVSQVTGYAGIATLSTVTIGAKNGQGGVEYPSTFTTTTSTTTLTGLPDGDYQLVELQAPAGYVLTDTTIDFSIANGELVGTDVAGRVSFNAQTLTITVTNTPGAELPLTGGPGTLGLAFVGMVLVAGASFLLLRRRLQA